MKIIKPSPDLQFEIQFMWHLSEISGRLKQLRIARKLAVTRVAERLQVPVAKILEIESGKTDFQLDLLLTMCELYEAKIEDVVSLFSKRRSNPKQPFSYDKKHSTL